MTALRQLGRYGLLVLYFVMGGRNTVTIAGKELRTYLASPGAYIIAAVFLAVTGVLFVNSISGTFPEAAVRGFLEPTALFVVPVIAPILSMRLLAEEQKLGTLELLLTAPVKDYQVVIGKFVASYIILILTISLTFYFVFLLAWKGDPDFGPILSGYLGFLLYTGAALSVGILASSLSANQIVAAMLGFGILLIFILLGQASELVSGIFSTILEEASVLNHFNDFSRGVIDTWNLVYYLTTIAIFLFLTIRSLESRRWR